MSEKLQTDVEAFEDEFDAIVVGAGFAGLYMLYRLRELGFSARVFERGSGVGGTWFWNRYPGARCDTESMDYSYSFSPELEQEWNWTERYPRQPEILAYINHVADRFDLRRDIQLNTRVTAAHFDEETSSWRVQTDDGTWYRAQFLITAAGCLSEGKQPDFDGLETFEGDWYLTSAWPEEPVDLTGKRVGVVGTGSTGIQVISTLAKDAAHLTVFQRTANFSVPAKAGPLADEDQRKRKATYREFRQQQRSSDFGLPVETPTISALDVSGEDREQTFSRAWDQGNPFGIILAYEDIIKDVDANVFAADFVRAKIRETVEDPVVADMLCPTDHPIATKRLCVDTDYYETYNRDNVTLVDLKRTPIERITPSGIQTSDAHYELDVIVFAIGFDAVTGALLAIDIRGRGGQSLRDTWRDGPRTYLGLGVAGFPNLLTITGPQSPSIVTVVIVSIEQHVEWIADCLAYLREHGVESIEATTEAQNEWIVHTAEEGDKTLFPKTNSWYVGANVPGKPRLFYPYIGGLIQYRAKCAAVAAGGYEGFVLTARERTA